MNTNKHELLYKELSYKVQGALIEVRKNFGPGMKEGLYQNALAEELESRGINFEREKAIKIYSPKTKKFIGLYRPDFTIEGKIILEVKTITKIPKLFMDQLYGYLRNSDFELGYFVNFAAPKLYIKRIIFTNDRKPFLLKTLVAISLVFVLFSVCNRAQAALLYSGSANEVVYEGQTFVVDWFLDTQGIAVNSMDLNLRYNTDVLEAVETSAGSSVVNLWVKAPEFDNATGTVALIGGIAGGIEASKLSVFRTTFLAKSLGTGRISLDENSTVLLSDGQGTVMKLAFQPLVFTVAAGSNRPDLIESPTHPDEGSWSRDNNVQIMIHPRESEAYSYSFSSNVEIFPDTEADEVGQPLVFPDLPDGIYYFKLNSKVGVSAWQEAQVYRFQIDQTAPEPFMPTIASEPTVLDGQPFVSFTTTDKVSGLAYYEVRTGILNSWTRTDQTFVVLPRVLLSDTVAVKAVDLAGNERVAEVAIEASAGKKIFTNPLIWIIMIIGLLAVVFLLSYLRKLKRKT